MKQDIKAYDLPQHFQRRFGAISRKLQKARKLSTEAMEERKELMELIHQLFGSMNVDEVGMQVFVPQPTSANPEVGKRADSNQIADSE